MSGGRKTIEHLAPWLGMLGAAAGWMVSQQVGSTALFDDCRDGGAWFVVAVSLAGLVPAVAGGFYSWDVWRQDEAETEGRRFLGLVGVLLAGVAAFAIVLQGVAGLILPRCVA